MADRLIGRQKQGEIKKKIKISGCLFFPMVPGMSAVKVQTVFIPVGPEFFHLRGRAIGSAGKQIPLRCLCLRPAKLAPVV